MLLTLGNLGRTLPTGSATGQVQPGRSREREGEKNSCNDGERDSRTTYLYRGTGNPWAGHCNVTEPSMVVRKLLESSIVGNLGLTLPTGSDHTV